MAKNRSAAFLCWVAVWLGCEGPAWAQYHLYWANLHSHTKYSDSKGSSQGEDANPSTAIAYARSIGGLDVFAVTDHSGFLTGAKWRDTQSQCAAQTEDGAFVALAGFEWAYGADHINVIGSPDYATSGEVKNLAQFYDWILTQAGEGRLMFCQFNHPGRATYFTHFDDFAYNSAVDPYFALIELFNSEKPDYRKGHEEHEPWYIMALDKGWHVAPAGNQDNHRGRYGDVNEIRTGIWASGLTETEVMEAILARRTFASEDKDTSLQFFLNGHWMGSTLLDPPGEISSRCLHCQIRVEGPQGVADIMILSRGGRTVWSEHRPPRGKAIWDIDLAYVGASYYFAKVRLDDGSLLYSAPIWVPESTAGFAAPLALPGGLSLIALPVVPNQTDPQKLLGFTDNRWARWDPRAGSYARYPEAPTWFDSHTPGRAYWILLDQPQTVSVVGTPVDPQTPFSIALEPGWNMIGNPFRAAVVWDVDAIKVRCGGKKKTLVQAQQAGWMEDWAWSWVQDEKGTGRYVPVYDSSIIPGLEDRLKPWQGYWVKASVPCELVLPPPERNKERGRNPRVGWTVQLQAQTEAGTAAVVLGVTEGRDWAAGPPPPPPNGATRPRAYLIDGQGQPLAMDLRSHAGSRQVWEFMVEQRAQGAEHRAQSSDFALVPPAEVTLTWPELGRSGPSNASLTLVDQATGAQQSLRTTSHYTYRPSRGERQRRFQIIAEPGRGNPLQITALQVVPTRGSERGMLITFQLTRSADTEVTLSTPTGRVVRRVEQGRTRAAGLQQVVWEGQDQAGRPVPPGVYLVEVVARDGEGPPARAARTVKVP